MPKYRVKRLEEIKGKVMFDPSGDLPYGTTITGEYETCTDCDLGKNQKIGGCPGRIDKRCWGMHGKNNNEFINLIEEIKERPVSKYRRIEL